MGSPAGAVEPSKAEVESLRDPPAVSASFRYGILIFLLLVSSLCSVLIVQYDPKHAHAVPTQSSPWVWNCGFRTSSTCAFHLPIPTFMIDPSAPVFVNTVLIFGTSVLICLGIRETDRYQNRIVVIGMVCGLILSAMMAIHKGEILSFKNIMPGVTTVALIMSMMLHDLQKVVANV